LWRHDGDGAAGGFAPFSMLLCGNPDRVVCVGRFPD